MPQSAEFKKKVHYNHLPFMTLIVPPGSSELNCTIGGFVFIIVAIKSAELHIPVIY